jgi:hypothetical protein
MAGLLEQQTRSQAGHPGSDDHDVARWTGRGREAVAEGLEKVDRGAHRLTIRGSPAGRSVDAHRRVAASARRCTVHFG